VTGDGRSRDAAPSLSVVVATRDRAGLLGPCLDALGRSVASSDEIIVVDSCSRRPDTAAVASAQGVRLVRCDVAGASLARNAGWRTAAHGVVAFIDDDVRVGPGWAGALRRAFRDHPDAAFITGRLGLKSQDARTEWPVAFFDGSEPLPIVPDVAANVGHGANLSVRRTALDLVGGYNEVLGPGARFHAGEDLELMDRLLAHGLIGRYEPAAEATHEQYRTRTELVRLEWRYGIGQGARLVLLRGQDRKRFTPVFRYVAVDGGLRVLLRCIKERYEFGAALVAARLVGMAVGALGATTAATWSRLGGRRGSPLGRSPRL
jgi:GT2 family glycosyltransferase